MGVSKETEQLVAGEYGTARKGEELPVERLEPYLRENLPGVSGPFSYSQFGGGRANLTYLLRFGDEEFVLRRPPLGKLAPRSHDMGREHRVLALIHPHFNLAPNSLLMCDDVSIIGAHFHVMQRRVGFTIIRDIPEPHANKPELNRRISEMLVDTLADFHNVDVTQPEFENFGRPEGYVERHLKGRSERWELAKTEDVPAVDQLIAWLKANVPTEQPAGLVHNDFKLDNVLLDIEDPAKAVAVLDWDMCTVGDPLTDLGFLLNYWLEEEDPEEWHSIGAMPTAQPGFLKRSEVIARYAEKTGRDVSAANWYFAFGILHIIVILQQIYLRFTRGQTEDQRFANYDERVRLLADKGLAIAGLGKEN